MTDLVEVTIADERWEGSLEDASALCVRAALAALGLAATARAGGFEVSIVLADDRFVRALNRKFRGVDKPTNVLAFPAEATGTPPGRPQPLGDIVLAFQTVAAEANEQSKALGHHVAHLVVHGALHLLGHDHEVDADAQAMEALEVRVLRQLGIADPYRVADPA